MPLFNLAPLPLCQCKPPCSNALPKCSQKSFRTTQVFFSWPVWSLRIVKRKYPFLGSGSYLLLLWDRLLRLFGNNNNLNFPLTEPWWNLAELFFWHKLLPKCCLHPLLRLVWNETLCGRRPPSIRTSWKLCWSLELIITLHSDADLYTDFHFSFPFFNNKIVWCHWFLI